MSQQLISRSPDLSKLKADGYEVEVVAGYLAIRNVPYVNDKRQVRRGALVAELTLAGDVTTKPKTHVVMFAGEYPCDKNGHPLEKIRSGTERKKINEGLVTQFTFSSKPGPNGYPDYYEQMTTYVAILESQAQAIDPNATARTWRFVETQEGESVFRYLDTASSRAGTTALSKKFEQQTVGIVGGGGTGSYVLDFVTKTPIKAAHIFDKDKFLQHNAFRSPGAASVEQLREIPPKVHYLRGIYSNMHRNVIPHEFNVDASNVECLREMDFVFLCLDGGPNKKIIIEKLEEWGVPFIDVGMGIELVDEKLLGVARVTTSTPEKRGHVRRRINFEGDGHENDYSKNIQIAELNALNAALAVIKWKKLLGVYVDLEKEYFSAYTIDGNTITNEDD